MNKNVSNEPVLKTTLTQTMDSNCRKFINTSLRAFTQLITTSINLTI